MLVCFTLLAGLILSSPLAAAEGVDVTNITVPLSCTMTLTENTPHTALIQPGTYQTDIGTSTITTICNSSEGFSIYAVGFSDDTYGKNVLVSDIDPSLDIATGTATSGTVSSWAIKLTPVENAYTPTIHNGFSSYSAVPSVYTKVASRESNTDTSIGASFQSTYAAYASRSQAAGTYTGQVKFALVHPGVNTPSSLPTMQDVAEWSASIAAGEETQAVDSRDGSIYTIARLADGNLWMTQNLRLDPSTANITSANTNSPSADFLTEIASSSSSDTWCTANSAECVDTVTFNTGNLGTEYDAYGTYYNWYTATAGNGTYSLSTLNTSTSGDICPSGWHLPTAGSSANFENSDFYKLSRAVIGADPASGNANQPYWYNTPDASEGANASQAMRSAPNNFLYSGYYFGSAANGRGSYGGYWSSTAFSAVSSFNFFLDVGYVYPTVFSSKFNGFAVRCLADA